MALHNRIANEQIGNRHHPEGAPFVHEAPGWHVLDITAGESDVLRIFEGLFGIHEQGFITDTDLLSELDGVMQLKDGALWQSSFPKSEEGSAAGLLEDIAFRRSLDPRWVTEQLETGQGEGVLTLARQQSAARELAERFVPIWFQVQAGISDESVVPQTS